MGLKPGPTGSGSLRIGEHLREHVAEQHGQAGRITLVQLEDHRIVGGVSGSLAHGRATGSYVAPLREGLECLGNRPSKTRVGDPDSRRPRRRRANVGQQQVAPVLVEVLRVGLIQVQHVGGPVDASRACIARTQHEVRGQLPLNVKVPGVEFRRASGIVLLPIAGGAAEVDGRTAEWRRRPGGQPIVDVEECVCRKCAVVERAVQDQPLEMSTAASRLDRPRELASVHADDRARPPLVGQAQARRPGLLPTIERVLLTITLRTRTCEHRRAQDPAKSRIGDGRIEVHEAIALAVTGEVGPILHAEHCAASDRAGVLPSQPQVQSQVIGHAPVILEKAAIVLPGLDDSAGRLQTPLKGLSQHE